MSVRLTGSDRRGSRPAREGSWSPAAVRTVGRDRIGDPGSTLRSLVGRLGPHQGDWRRAPGSQSPGVSSVQQAPRRGSMMDASRRPPGAEDQSVSQRNIVYIVGAIIVIAVVVYFLRT